MPTVTVVLCLLLWASQPEEERQAFPGPPVLLKPVMLGGLLNPWGVSERLWPFFSCFCVWPRQQSPCGRNGGCGVIGSSCRSGAIAQTSAVLVSSGAPVWHCSSATGVQVCHSRNFELALVVSLCSQSAQLLLAHSYSRKRTESIWTICLLSPLQHP